jgi:O-antigen ligase/polysaccharide polymerase Wzy-like membrane protein
MKAAFLPRSPMETMLVGFLFWFGSYAPLFVFRTFGLKPLYSYIAMIVLAIFYSIARGAATGTLDILREKRIRWFLAWLLAYVAWGALAFQQGSQSDIAIQVLITLVEMVMLGFAFAALMVNPRRLRLVGAAFVLLAIFDILIFIFDFFHPTFTKNPGRAAGFYVDPNVASYALSLIMVCAIESVPRRLRWAFVLACGLGVLLTFSRSGWIVWGIGVTWMGWQSDSRSGVKKLAIVAACLLLGVGFLVMVFFGGLGELLLNTPIGSHLDASTLARLGVTASSLSGHSADLHREEIWYSFREIGRKPLFGYGLGYVYEWELPIGPHDMYLRFFVEGGLCGLLLYLLLMALLWFTSSGVDRVLALQIVIASFFNHNLLEIPTVIMVMTFLLTRAGMRRRRQREEMFALRNGYA